MSTRTARPRGISAAIEAAPVGGGRPRERGARDVKVSLYTVPPGVDAPTRHRNVPAVPDPYVNGIAIPLALLDRTCDVLQPRGVNTCVNTRPSTYPLTRPHAYVNAPTRFVPALDADTDTNGAVRVKSNSSLYTVPPDVTAPTRHRNVPAVPDPYVNGIA